MKDTKIIFRWTDDGIEKEKEIDRDKVYAVFDGLTKGFADDNKISKQLITIIPTVDVIAIDKDLNTTQDVPFIVAYIGDEIKVIKIIRYHKIVWTILNKYTSEDEVVE